MTENNQNNILDFEIADEDIENIFSTKDLDKTKERETFLKNLNQYLEVQAVPGSGKTKILGVKIGLLLKKWKYKNSGICVLTHTNVAKEEILKSCKEINKNCELEHFPHFIGTIQEFVDKFLAMPYLKSYIKDFEFNNIDKEYDFSKFTNRKIKLIDIEEEKSFGELFHKKLKKFVDKIYFTKFDLDDDKKCKLNYNFSEIEYIKNKNGEQKNPEKYFIYCLKEYKIKKGHLIYKDMYAFANVLIEKNSIILDYIRNRFKICFVDEAQDTNKTQGELLKKIFKESENNIFQISGDNNQKIYDFGNDGDYNFFEKKQEKLSKDDLFHNKQTIQNDSILMNKTYRFCSNIGNLVNSFAIDKNDDVKYHLKEGKQDKKPYLILYDDPKNVLTKFLEILEENNLTKIDRKIAIIGAVNKDKKKKRKNKDEKNECEIKEKNKFIIKDYIENFSKQNDKEKFKTQDIIEAFKFIKNHKIGDFKENYRIIFDALFYNFSKDKDKSRENFKKFLKENNINQNIILIINTKEEITEELIKNTLFANENFSSYFNLEYLFKKKKQNQGKIKNYISKEVQIKNKKYFHKYNFDKNELEFYSYLEKEKKEFIIKVDTIHGVKGETHDATLVLETFNEISDISYFLKNLNTENYNKLRHNLYVAFSRPKTLLCLASSRIECQKISEDIRKLFIM